MTMKLSTPDTQSLSDIEKGDMDNEKDDIKTKFDNEQQDTGVTPLQATIGKQISKEATPESIMNAFDWNGPDDPDNPHNCQYT